PLSLSNCATGLSRLTTAEMECSVAARARASESRCCSVPQPLRLASTNKILNLCSPCSALVLDAPHATNQSAVFRGRGVRLNRRCRQEKPTASGAKDGSRTHDPAFH